MTSPASRALRVAGPGAQLLHFGINYDWRRLRPAVLRLRSKDGRFAKTDASFKIERPNTTRCKKLKETTQRQI